MLSSLEAVVIDLLLSQSPAYGLDLVARSRNRLKRGSVYVTLGRMEAKGLVRSWVEERPGEGPPRRQYEATSLGLRAFVARQIIEGDLPLGAKG